MTLLSDTQTLILNTAAQRLERLALPLPKGLRGSIARNVVGAMLTKGLLQEVDANPRQGEPLWRETGDGHGTTLIATDAGLAAIGITPETRGSGPVCVPETPDAPNDAAHAQFAPKARTQREGTKQATLIAMLQLESGATIEEFSSVSGWQAHTVRGAIAGTLKKKLGLVVTSEMVDGRGRVYRLPSP
jgi:hypothetical protein